MRHPADVSDERLLLRSYEWPLVMFGLALGVVWTLVAVLWALTSDELLSPSSALDWIRAILLLPALVSVAVGEALFRLGFGFEELGVIAGLAVAISLCSLGLVALARRA